MKETTCCFTGHRRLPVDSIENILINLDREIEGLIARGVTNFISGGALGFDQLAALLILAKKETGQKIRLILALPCKNQHQAWNEAQKELFRNILDGADEVKFISEAYDPLCMARRNRYMVEHSAVCLCALLHEKSGTAQTVRYARKKGLKIIHVIPQLN